MTGSKRQQKFSKLIQKEISQILQQEHSGSFLGKLVTVTDVEMSPDLGLARLYVSVFPVSASDQILDYLNGSKSKIRGSLGRAIGKEVRVIPELAIFLDNTAELASKMDSLIEGLDIPEEPEKEEE